MKDLITFATVILFITLFVTFWTGGSPFLDSKEIQLMFEHLEKK